jgi:hypothetical protein
MAVLHALLEALCACNTMMRAAAAAAAATTALAGAAWTLITARAAIILAVSDIGCCNLSALIRVDCSRSIVAPQLGCHRLFGGGQDISKHLFHAPVSNRVRVRVCFVISLSKHMSLSSLPEERLKHKNPANTAMVNSIRCQVFVVEEPPGHPHCQQ